jgi:GT2 family glycosyltransferase
MVFKKKTDEMNHSTNTAGRKVAVLIPVFNRKNDVLSMIQQLIHQDYKNIVIVVIDDGSSDGTADAVSSLHPDVVVLKGDGNLWWAGAINKGIEWAQHNNVDFVLTLNDDQKITNDFLSVLMEYTSVYPDCILGSLIYLLGEEKTIFSAGITFAKHRTRADFIAQMAKDVGQFTEPFDVDMLPGWSVLIPMTVVNTIGAFDATRWPQVYMECEFCIRVKQHGFRILTVPKSKVWNDRKDKEQTAYWNSIGFKKMFWLLTEKKSHLEFRQYFYFQKALYGSWSRLLTVGFYVPVYYFIQIVILGFTTGTFRRKIKAIYRGLSE